jgi:hypothetical protein
MSDFAGVLGRAYRWDYDNKLATALQAQQRDGDPNEEGIVWHRFGSRFIPTIRVAPDPVLGQDVARIRYHEAIAARPHPSASAQH